jgi:hypothetical protein
MAFFNLATSRKNSRLSARRVSRAALVLAAVITLGIGAAAQATVNAQVGELKGVWTYTDYGTGDVVIVVQNPPAGCVDGFWLRMTDVGAKTVYANLLAAYYTKTRLRIDGYDNQLWAGSTGQYCRIYAVGPGV